MTTFVLLHGAGDVGWYWHLVVDELHRRGHDAIAPDLPCDDAGATFHDYADAVVNEVGDRRDLVVVAQSYGAFTAPLVAARLPVDVLVLVAGMIPTPGEPPADWWRNTGHGPAVREQARRDGGVTGHDDPSVTYYHDVPHGLAEQAQAKARSEAERAYTDPWPLDAWPYVTTRFVVCTRDRAFPAAFMRRLAADRLGIVPDEIDAGHCVALSRPRELAALLIDHAGSVG